MYKIVVSPSEGGYIAYIAKLDCYGDGKTAEEAIEDVRTVASDIIAIYNEEQSRREQEIASIFE